MKRIFIITITLLTIILFINTCNNKSINTNKNSNVTDAHKPLPVIVSTKISPTLPAVSLNLYGRTPLGVKILKSSDRKDLSDYIFINSKKGWKVTYEYLGMFRQNISIHKTDNGGSNWEKVTSTFDKTFSIPTAATSGIIFINDRKGFITTETPQSGFVGLYKTSDAGVTWKLKKLNIPQQYKKDMFGTYPPVFFTLNDALLLTYSYGDDKGKAVSEQLVFVTHDGGEKWTKIKENEDDVFQWNYSEDPLKGIASGWSIKYKHRIWNTLNGITWKTK